MNEIELKRMIGNRLKAAREGTAYNQQDIAELLGVERTAYGHIEAGRNLVRVDHLIKLAQIFNRPISYFLGITENGFTPDEQQLLAIYRRLPVTGPYRLFAYRALLSLLQTIEEAE